MYTLCPFFGPEKNTDGSGVGLTISLASACYGDSQVAKHFLCLNMSSNQYGGGAILALSSFLNQIPHQKEPEISVGIFSPT